MRKIILSGLILLSGMANAAAPINSWYTNIFGGVTYLPKNFNNVIANNTWNNSSYHFGYNAGGSFGFKSNPLRYEGQFTYLKADIKNFNVNGIMQSQTQGYSSAALLMANVFYDFPDIVPAIAPYLGAGIGYGYISTHVGGIDSSSPSFHVLKDNDSIFAYQAMVGLNYNFAESYSVNIGYRYIGTSNIDYLNNTFEAHVAEVGASYRFDGVAYK